MGRDEGSLQPAGQPGGGESGWPRLGQGLTLVGESLNPLG